MDAHLVAKEIDVSILKIVTRIQFIYICDLKHLNLKIIIIILIIFLEFFVKLFEFEKKI